MSAAITNHNALLAALAVALAACRWTKVVGPYTLLECYDFAVLHQLSTWQPTMLAEQPREDTLPATSSSTEVHGAAQTHRTVLATLGQLDLADLSYVDIVGCQSAVVSSTCAMRGWGNAGGGGGGSKGVTYCSRIAFRGIYCYLRANNCNIIIVQQLFQCT